MDELALWDSYDLKHDPIRPPRDGADGEQVFAELWKSYMDELPNGDDPPNARLGYILQDLYGIITQRHASIAASFVTWLGTNSGSCFLIEAERWAESLKKTDSRTMAFLGCWHATNTRLSFINSGVRTIEHILSPEENLTNGPLGWKVGRCPDISSDDLEVVDKVVVWLATDEGTEFIKRCTTELDMRRNQKNAEFIRRLKNGKAALKPLTWGCSCGFSGSTKDLITIAGLPSCPSCGATGGGVISNEKD